MVYGRYDVDWLVSTVTVGEAEHYGYVVGFDLRKAVSVVQQFLSGRSALYSAVYHHKTVRIVEGMVGKFLLRMRQIIDDGYGGSIDLEFVSSFIDMVAGKPVGLQEVVSLDDSSLWVLIRYVSSLEEGDITALDLARRIVERDLFKIVPLSAMRVGRYLQQEANATVNIQNAIRPFCRGEAEYYLIVDSTTFSMFSDDPNQSCYFVDERRRARTARDHEQFGTSIQRGRVYGKAVYRSGSRGGGR